jgi:hypothetical protein
MITDRFRFVDLAGATEDGGHLASGAGEGEGDRALEGLLQLEVGQLDVGVHGHVAVVTEEGREALSYR